MIKVFINFLSWKGEHSNYLIHLRIRKTSHCTLKFQKKGEKCFLFPVFRKKFERKPNFRFHYCHCENFVFCRLVEVPLPISAVNVDITQFTFLKQKFQNDEMISHLFSRHLKVDFGRLRLLTKLSTSGYNEAKLFTLNPLYR